jgi:hypothetical protein
MWDRLVVDAFTWSVAIGLAAPMATFVSVALGAWLLLRQRWSRRPAWIVAFLIGVSVFATVVFQLWFWRHAA